jgi:hypothetical protein
MKRVNALASRGCSTTVPDTVADGDTGPSFVAPLGISGFGATTFEPVGAAAPAPAAEIVKHTNANTALPRALANAQPASSAPLLSHGTCRPAECGPQSTRSYRTDRAVDVKSPPSGARSGVRAGAPRGRRRRP